MISRRSLGKAAASLGLSGFGLNSLKAKEVLPGKKEDKNGKKFPDEISIWEFSNGSPGGINHGLLSTKYLNLDYGEMLGKIETFPGGNAEELLGWSGWFSICLLPSNIESDMYEAMKSDWELINDGMEVPFARPDLAGFATSPQEHLREVYEKMGRTPKFHYMENPEHGLIEIVNHGHDGLSFTHSRVKDIQKKYAQYMSKDHRLRIADDMQFWGMGYGLVFHENWNEWDDYWNPTTKKWEHVRKETDPDGLAYDGLKRAINAGMV